CATQARSSRRRDLSPAEKFSRIFLYTRLPENCKLSSSRSAPRRYQGLIGEAFRWLPVGDQATYLASLGEIAIH
ncbi:MAG TPA: hypothetical protein VFH59_13295, partial [Frateuria sp.]|uniref:hypothetical protein n=1 Tax=Frateuria sp. TaxID=2211372 RepID=UPI002D808A04